LTGNIVTDLVPFVEDKWMTGPSREFPNGRARRALAWLET